MVIDCDRCRMRDIACRDCVVTVLLELSETGDRVELDVAEAQAISVLAGSGLVPPLRLVPTGRLGQPGDSGTYDDGHGSGESRAG